MHKNSTFKEITYYLSGNLELLPQLEYQGDSELHTMLKNFL